MKAQKKKQVNRLEMVHPQIIKFWARMEKEFQKRSMPMKAFELYRSNDRQARLVKQKVTKAGPGQSPHNYGMAVDIVHGEKYWDLTRTQWDIVGAIGKEVARKIGVKMEWGGDWTFYDPAHWQLAEWKARRDDPEKEAKAVAKWVTSESGGQAGLRANYFEFLEQIAPVSKQ